MTKNAATTVKTYPEPVVTTRTRKPREGFVNPNRGIEVAKGLNLQDVPREMIQRHLKENEQLAKKRFQQKYGHQYGGQQSF
jgi:hypothetical protein